MESERAFGRRQFEVIDVALHSHSECSCQSFEDAFNLVVLVVAFGLDVEVHVSRVAQAFEEMEKHFGWHVADVFAFEVGLPNKPRPASEVEGYGA